jgi:iron complex outermembrane receptor protein
MMMRYERLSLTAVVFGLVLSARTFADEAAGLEEVIVTAQKRAQSLQDVSLSVSSLDQSSVVDNVITDVTDFGTRIPNVVVGNVLGMAQITIRGLGQPSALIGSDPSVALHVDGAVVSQPMAQLGSFFDLDRIEVLRGPQGTLYGRNATGGVVNLITAKPTETLEGYFRGTLGNYDLMMLEGALSGPIAGDKLLGRIAVKNETRAGYGRNEYTGNEIDDAKRQGVRAQVQLNATDDITFRLSGEWSGEDDHNYGAKFVTAVYPGATAPNLVPRGLGGYAANPRRNVKSEIDTLNDRSTWAVTGTLDWRLNDAFALRSLTDYREMDIKNMWDWDTGSNITGLNNYTAGNSDQFSQELQLIYNAGPFNGLLAAYYFDENLLGDTRVGQRPAEATAADVRSLLLQYLGTVDIKSWALFGNLSYEMTDHLTLAVGGRYTQEKRSGSITLFTPPTATAPWEPSRTTTNFSPKATLEWHFDSAAMAYATYSEGFRSGVLLTTTVNTPVLKPELVTNYEVGLKSTLFDRKLLLNIAVFYEDFKDLQVGRTQPTLNPVVVAVIYENAAAATSQGVEAEFAWAATRGFSVDGSVGYLDAKYDDFVTASVFDLPNAVLLQRAGNALRMAPEWTGRVGIHYAFPAWRDGELSLHASGQYRSSMVFDESSNPLLSEPGVTLWDANIMYHSQDERIVVNLWGKNLTDKFYYPSKFTNSTSRQILGLPGDPRTYGVSIGYNF